MSIDSKKIIRAVVSENSGSFGMGLVEVILEGGAEEKEELFTYYPDELSFNPSEFIGLTLEEAAELKLKKDLKYLGVSAALS